MFTAMALAGARRAPSASAPANGAAAGGALRTAFDEPIEGEVCLRVSEYGRQPGGHKRRAIVVSEGDDDGRVDDQALGMKPSWQSLPGGRLRGLLTPTRSLGAGSTRTEAGAFAHHRPSGVSAADAMK